MGFILFVMIMLTRSLVLPILTLTVCCVAHYVHLTMEEALEEMKGCQSPSRRARMTTRIIELYDRLNQLIEPTNRIAGPLMFTQYVNAVYPFSLLITFVKWQFFKGEYHNVVVNISAHYVVIMSLVMYLWYLRVSAKANKMRSLIAKELVETVLKDDQWLSRDLGLRTLLLKTRLVHLAHLTHLNFEQQNFTFLNEPIDDEDSGIFSYFIGLIDNYNTFSAVDPKTRMYSKLYSGK